MTLKIAPGVVLALLVTILGVGCGGRGPANVALETTLAATVATDKAIDQLDTLAQERILRTAPSPEVGRALFGAYRARREQVLRVLAETYATIASAAGAAAGDEGYTTQLAKARELLADVQRRLKEL